MDKMTYLMRREKIKKQIVAKDEEERRQNLVRKNKLRNKRVSMMKYMTRNKSDFDWKGLN